MENLCAPFVGEKRYMGKIKIKLNCPRQSGMEGYHNVILCNMIAVFEIPNDINVLNRKRLLLPYTKGRK